MASDQEIGAGGRRAQDPRFVSQLTRNTFALILAGGRGSRLHELTDFRAKPAVPFGGKYRIIDFTLSNCVNSGVRRVGVATQYKAQSLIRHLQLGWSFLDGRLNEFIEIMPAQQQSDEVHWYQGTADAVFQNLREIRHARPEYVLILSGDHIYRMDYGRVLAAHVARQADLTVACIEVPLTEASSFGVMSVDAEGRVLEFAEKPTEPQHMPGDPAHALASMGIYVFNTSFLIEQLLRDADDPKSSHDFGKDVIPHCVKRYRTFAQNFAESCVSEPGKPPYWRDVGTLDAYWAANMDLVQVTPDLNLYSDNWPIWTWQPQTPPAKFVFDDDTRRGKAVDSMVSGGCIVSGATVRRSMLFSGVHVHSYATIEDSMVLPNVQVGRHCILKKCIIDKNCVLPEGTIIGMDPEQDKKRFRVTDSGITLVTKEMLGQGLKGIR
ncbi:glucose-1-phosphate adenylyltransferase [Rhodoferax sp.]|uniref:glucose-1-phosphate adenylyltransferase n=1 Tax=Rhodoferax sp. TaxID=50421 RepID=UPI0027316BD2|nr:glucose-1-phosphate adenylyltransferase [Rhodoferax sp.]MDP1531640.1 glucose-1-phosphate adenylyltransferase [Rhodoferax sp.]MDP1944197.1 glucose-1-phosphate adenylyltransferase [Rhodoferax sp.]MDP2441149.1 glucose-1-phosphate adenylyltransferase [Rhodoferax sp.]MDZ4209475.1 glucose-1-phosphate adenylyltransferase [Rhodoferax sp.]